MFDLPLRSLRDALTHPLTQQVPLDLSPTRITLLALVSGLLSIYAASTRPLSSSADYVSPALVLWLLNRALDCLDGAVARQRGQVTAVGGFLDLLGDFVVYAGIPVGVAWNETRKALALGGSTGEGVLGVAGAIWLPVALLEAACWINNFVLFYGAAAMAGKRSEGELTSVPMRPALVEGFEAGLFFTAMLIWPGWVGVIAWVMTGAVVVGTVQRSVWLVGVLGGLDRDAERLKTAAAAAEAEEDGEGQDL